MIDIHRHLPTAEENPPPDSWKIWYASSTPEEWQAMQVLTLPDTCRRGYGLLPTKCVNIETAVSSLADLVKSDPHGYFGEFGLDYRYRHIVPQDHQFSLAVELLRLARYMGRPAVLHHVGPMGDLEAVLKAVPGTSPVIVHGYLKSVESARRLATLGATISLGPPVWKKATKLGRRLAEIDIPFLLETDFQREDGDTYTETVTEHTMRIADLMDMQREEIEELCNGYAQVFENWSSIGR
jgi:Tat protein secretion system quality control protein TatD with DNase activity